MIRKESNQGNEQRQLSCKRRQQMMGKINDGNFEQIKYSGTIEIEGRNHKEGRGSVP